MRDRCVLTKLKLASDYTATRTFSPIAGIPVTQLWQRRAWGVQEREEGWAQEAADAVSIEASSLLSHFLEFCPNKISHPTEMALLWIKECLKEDSDKTGRLELQAPIKLNRQTKPVSCGWVRQPTEGLAVLALRFLLPQVAWMKVKGKHECLQNQGKTKWTAAWLRMCKEMIYFCNQLPEKSVNNFKISLR